MRELRTGERRVVLTGVVRMGMWSGLAHSSSWTCSPPSRAGTGPIAFFFSSRRRHTRYWRDWSSDVWSSDLLPLGLVSALLVGSWISRRALEPVDRIITEVREISDGRSLHRRLAEPMVKDELGRLAETLNQDRKSVV